MGRCRLSCSDGIFYVWKFPVRYSGLTKTGTALPRPGSKGTIP
ncbi:hypothetical protein C4H39_01955 [Neisseria gonorrhoeae]|uniref:Uncharacterized protein n=2 Tax=Neisseria gonorrhoeae TaxID=485 RepID=B4RPQ0_NEIG2|nr:Conserved hypothetical protein [Neisseria gonorrhoeae NCCP11945]ANJ48766.1 hypothetical protein ASO12_10695 [Neisseria gonorrhoeae]EEZ44599.1 conserved hypothetical protein [Neisseria gonorrhoeae 35/02]KMY26192.1 hypothetical protein NGDG_01830 [Neisseria gonorrhoeae FA6140]ARC02676.1 hypothetical protein A6J46_01670 [Neisseria gonorrhoeae]